MATLIKGRKQEEAIAFVALRAYRFRVQLKLL